MEKMFLNKEFEFGGKVGSLDKSKGNFFGVYLVVLPHDFGEVHFMPSKLKFWRDSEVSIPIEELQNKWKQHEEILYIGCSASKYAQKRVLCEHLPFWKGEKPTRAFGGRVIGQIQNFENLEVWYLRCETPLQMKKNLLKEFKGKYGVRPFANLKD